MPGKIFKARVQEVIDVMARYVTAERSTDRPGQAPGASFARQTLARIERSPEDTRDYRNYQGGVVAEVAVYTDHWHSCRNSPVRPLHEQLDEPRTLRTLKYRDAGLLRLSAMQALRWKRGANDKR